MKITTYIIAGIMILAGLTFFFQGVGILPGSYMTGQIFWAYVGFFLVVIGGGLAFLAYRRGRGV
jgi:hypothetical protein